MTIVLNLGENKVTAAMPVDTPDVKMDFSVSLVIGCPPTEEWTDAGKRELLEASKRDFRKGRIRTNQEAFLMTEGLTLYLLIDKKREECVQRSVEKVDNESLGMGGFYSALKQSVAKGINSEIQRLLDRKRKEKPQNSLADVIKSCSDYDEERPEDEEARKAVRIATTCSGVSIKYYAVWLVRSALYGNWKAQKVLERYDVYKEISLIPEWMMVPPGSRGEEAAQTGHNALDVGDWELRRAGFTDVPDQEFECWLKPLEENGTYRFWYQSDYSPADESGFGREDEYETVYLDEFFNFVGLETEKQKLKELNGKLRALRARRDRYWSSPPHDKRRRGIQKEV